MNEENKLCTLCSLTLVLSLYVTSVIMIPNCSMKASLVLAIRKIAYHMLHRPHLISEK